MIADMVTEESTKLRLGLMVAGRPFALGWNFARTAAHWEEVEGSMAWVVSRIEMKVEISSSFFDEKLNVRGWIL